jgi:hypothetical protein
VCVCVCARARACVQLLHVSPTGVRRIIDALHQMGIRRDTAARLAHYKEGDCPSPCRVFARHVSHAAP